MATTAYNSSGLIPNDTIISDPSVSTSYSSSGITPNDIASTGVSLLLINRAVANFGGMRQ